MAELRPEPDNPYDPAAVAVLIRGWNVGYLSREDARRYEAEVRRAIVEHGVATCSAVIRGGKDPEPVFSTVLRSADAPPVLAPKPDEFRLPSGDSLASVSNEQEYQDALTEAVGRWDLSGGSLHVVAELVAADTNPHMKKDPGRVIEVRVDGRTVGFLTKAMSDKYFRAVELAQAQGKRATCVAAPFAGNKGGQDIIEVRLHVTPHV